MKKKLLILTLLTSMAAQVPVQAATSNSQQSTLVRAWAETKRKAKAIFTKRNIIVIGGIIIATAGFKFYRSSKNKPSAGQPGDTEKKEKEEKTYKKTPKSDEESNNSAASPSETSTTDSEKKKTEIYKTLIDPYDGKCQVCYEERLLVPDTSKCRHAHCADCLIQRIDQAIKENSLNELRCIDPDCKEEIEQCDIIRIYNNPEKGHEHASFTFRQYVDMHQDIFKKCPDCPFMVYVDNAAANNVVFCDQCQAFFCLRCLTRHDEDQACPVQQQPSSQHAKDEEETARKTMPCPRCNRRVFRDEGCNHMTCTRPCDHQFCWVCGRDWNGHKGGFHTCQYDPTNDRNAIPQQQPQNN